MKAAAAPRRPETEEYDSSEDEEDTSQNDRTCAQINSHHRAGKCRRFLTSSRRYGYATHPLCPDVEKLRPGYQGRCAEHRDIGTSAQRDKNSGMQQLPVNGGNKLKRGRHAPEVMHVDDDERATVAPKRLKGAS